MPTKARAVAKKMDWDLVAEAIRNRREELRLNQDELPGVSDATLYKLENGRQTSYKPFILRNVERALDWAPGTVERIGHGETAEASVEDRLARVEEQLRALVPLAEMLREWAKTR